MKAKKKSKTKEVPDDAMFAMVCFLVLMQNNNGIISKHPDYISEKLFMLKEGAYAYGMLDRGGQQKVLEWCRQWRLDLPEWVEEYLHQEREILLNNLGSIL